MLIDVVKVEVLLVDVEQLDYEGTADEFGLLQHLALFLLQFSQRMERLNILNFCGRGSGHVFVEWVALVLDLQNSLEHGGRKYWL
jgi:hypothetical protein